MTYRNTPPSFSPFQERRTATRVPVSMTIGNAASGRTVGFGYARDISERGMAVDAEALVGEELPPRIGEELHMRFKLPKSDIIIAARGRVVRIEPGKTCPRIALEFVALASDFSHAITRFIHSRLAA